MMIPVVFITDENFIMQTGVAITSLVNNRQASTKYDIFVIAAECEREKLEKLCGIKLNGCRLSFTNVSLQKYSDIKQLEHIPIACLLKFDICDLVQEYDKLIYLDGDIYVRGDLSELYAHELGDAYIGGVPSVEMIHSQKKMINAGIMLFNAKKMRDDKMAERLLQVRKGLGDRGSMDQQTFNLVMADTMKFLPVQFNFIPEKIIGAEKKIFPLKKLNNLYGTSYVNKGDMEKDAVIIHYAAKTKPWKYNFAPCGEEWYRCYCESIFASYPLKRATRLESKVLGFIRTIKKVGIRGVIGRIAELINQSIGIRGKKGSEWG